MFKVLKANGEIEPFSEDKLKFSLSKAGLPQNLHEEALKHIKNKLRENIPTSEIYNQVNYFLEKNSPMHKTKYSLKQAIMELGPTGYPFEDYISKLMQAQGYTTLVRQIIEGKCVNHEIDVIAKKNTVLPTAIMIEAKFHNQLGIRTDLHVSLYTKARFDDCKEKNNFSGAMLATNTKITTDALAYALCSGMEILSWSYPENKGLRELIEEYHLYPITVINKFTQREKELLTEKGIVLCSDICKNHELLSQLNIDKQRKENIINEINFVCSK